MAGAFIGFAEQLSKTVAFTVAKTQLGFLVQFELWLVLGLIKSH
jgi:hypothetical protein